MAKKQVSLPIAVVLVLIAGAAAFFGGMQYQNLQRGNMMFSAENGRGGRMIMGQGGQNGKQVFAQGFRPVNGEIISTDGDSITVKMEDGSSKIVMVGDSTKINESKEASKSALAVGQKVAVVGNEKDGLITADMIQLNPGNLMIRR